MINFHLVLYLSKVKKSNNQLILEINLNNILFYRAFISGNRNFNALDAEIEFFGHTLFQRKNGRIHLEDFDRLRNLGPSLKMFVFR
jgi:hypothetical protein